MRRREFITLTLLGGAAATWRPLTAEAQQPDQLRRVGVLMNRVADNPEGQAAVAALGKPCSNWAGATAAIFGLTCAGA